MHSGVHARIFRMARDIWGKLTLFSCALKLKKKDGELLISQLWCVRVSVTSVPKTACCLAS